MRATRNVTCYLVAQIGREGDMYVAQCVGLPVVTQGETEREARCNLMEAIELFIESCVRRGTLEQVLLKYQWSPKATPPQELPPREVALPFSIPPHVAKLAMECQ